MAGLTKHLESLEEVYPLGPLLQGNAVKLSEICDDPFLGKVSRGAQDS